MRVGGSPETVPGLQHLAHADLGTEGAKKGRESGGQQDEAEDDQGGVSEVEAVCWGQHAKGDTGHSCQVE